LIEGSTGNTCCTHNSFRWYIAYIPCLPQSVEDEPEKTDSKNCVPRIKKKQQQQQNYVHMIRLIIGFDKSCRPIIIQFSRVKSKTISAGLLRMGKAGGTLSICEIQL
jgi:hypothetical protein